MKIGRYKKFPKNIPPGYSVTIHLSPTEFELVTFPATASKPERTKWCHKVEGYSIKKTVHEPWKHKSEEELLSDLMKELNNAKSG